MPGIVGPANYPIRDVKTRPQHVGRILNPVGFSDVGGLTGAGKWPKGNEMKVEKPGGASGAKKTTRRNED